MSLFRARPVRDFIWYLYELYISNVNTLTLGTLRITSWVLASGAIIAVVPMPFLVIIFAAFSFLFFFVNVYVFFRSG